MLSINQFMNRSINHVDWDSMLLHCLGCVDLTDGEGMKPGSFIIIKLFTEMLSINQSMVGYQCPIPLHCLGCVDLADGEAVKPYSFHHHVTLNNQMLSNNQLMNLSINQVYRDPIPLHCLGCVDLADGVGEA
jgi:hypothetical protein